MYTYVVQYAIRPQALGRRGAGVAELTDRSARFWRQFTLGPLMVRLTELSTWSIYSVRGFQRISKMIPTYDIFSLLTCGLY